MQAKFEASWQGEEKRRVEEKSNTKVFNQERFEVVQSEK
jgi:hypothetical protein